MSKYYWGSGEEDAIVRFNTIDNIQEKHDLYVNIIEPAFHRLVENIYYAYNFNKTLYDFNTIRHEAITHLYEKLNRYDPNRNKKSYSYFGTIVKNWLIQQSNSFKKQIFIDGDSKDTVIHDLSVEQHKHNIVDRDSVLLINKLVEELTDTLIEEESPLSHDDKKVLSIIIEVLKEYHLLEIHNKKKLYVYIREATDLPSRKITKSLNKIRTIYSDIKFDFVEK